MSEWKTIETVNDGDRVLVYMPEGNLVCEALAYQDGSCGDPLYSEWSSDGATHWMPLPNPPVIP